MIWGVSRFIVLLSGRLLSKNAVQAHRSPVSSGSISSGSGGRLPSKAEKKADQGLTRPASADPLALGCAGGSL